MPVGSSLKNKAYSKQSCYLHILWNIKFNGCRRQQSLNVNAHQLGGGHIHCTCKAETS